MLQTFTSTTAQRSGILKVKRHSVSFAWAAIAASLATLLGCTSKPTHTTTTTTHQPPSPTTPPPPFTIFHQANSTFTLVTTPTATDAQIAALIYQLRDAAQTHTFDHLNIPQSKVDARDPMAWFHIYRGPKCAPEKYADGAPPCGASYHAAGDYTFGGGPNHQWDDGVLLHPTPTGEDHETQLWPPGSPYTP
jgi:hypothetical protein